MSEFKEENLIKAKKIISNNKDYNKEKNLRLRIQMFELYKFASNWIKKYNSQKQMLF